MSESKGFTSSFGAIAAAVGSAVGLGNIWRFPYICGQYGGGAFLLVYLCFVFLIGMALMITEFVMGRRTGRTPIFAYETLAPTPKQRWWRYAGLLGLITSFLILALYLVISGWTTNYFAESLTGTLANLDSDGITEHFNEFSSSALRPVVFIGVFLAICAAVIVGGVQKGIERVSKILMPVLVVLLAVLCVRSATLPGAAAGFAYLFKPDFSQLTGQGVLAALGQALFSLSVGMGVMIVYGSYLPKNDNLLKTSIWITVCDTLIAILAGIAIFPAVFDCEGLKPNEGPGLVFKTLPVVFNKMNPAEGLQIGTIFETIFFMLLVIAALTSAISLLEALVAWGEEYKHDGKKSHRTRNTVIICVLLLMLSAALSLSNGVWSNFHIGGKTLYEFVDQLDSIYLPPICSLCAVIFLGWVMNKDAIKDELSNHGTVATPLYGVFMFVVRYVAPIALVIVLATGIVNSLQPPVIVNN